VNYDNSLVVTITEICYSWATSSGDHLFTCAPSTDRHNCYRIDTWAIRLPWLTFVNALANSMLGHFYTVRIQRFASCAWPLVLRKLGN